MPREKKSLRFDPLASGARARHRPSPSASLEEDGARARNAKTFLEWMAAGGLPS